MFFGSLDELLKIYPKYKPFLFYYILPFKTYISNINKIFAFGMKYIAFIFAC